MADIRLFHLQPLNQLLPQKRAESKYAISRNHPVCPTRLIPSRTVHKLSFSINLKTSKDVFWPRYSSVVGYVALIRDMDPASSSTRSHAALVAGSTSRSTALFSSVYLTKAPTAGRCHGLRLGSDSRVAVGMLCNDSLEDI